MKISIRWKYEFVWVCTFVVKWIMFNDILVFCNVKYDFNLILLDNFDLITYFCKLSKCKVGEMFEDKKKRNGQF